MSKPKDITYRFGRYSIEYDPMDPTYAYHVKIVWLSSDKDVRDETSTKGFHTLNEAIDYAKKEAGTL